MTTYSDEPTPAEVEDLLSQIEKSSRDLNSALCRLQVLSNRLRDPTAPHRRGHLGWLDAYISQAAAGLLSDDVNESEQHLLVVEFGEDGLSRAPCGCRGRRQGCIPAP